jgi:lysozyme
MISDRAKQIIKDSESCVLTAYECAKSKELPKSKKFWTIGWGNTKYQNGSKVKPGDVINQAQADALFDYYLEDFEKGVRKLLKVSLNDDQVGALVSLAYNIGLGALKSSTLLKLLNADNIAGAAEQFNVWTKCNGKVLNGLVTRRRKEYKLFVG